MVVETTELQHHEMQKHQLLQQSRCGLQLLRELFVGSDAVITLPFALRPPARMAKNRKRNNRKSQIVLLPFPEEKGRARKALAGPSRLFTLSESVKEGRSNLAPSQQQKLCTSTESE